SLDYSRFAFINDILSKYILGYKIFNEKSKKSAFLSIKVMDKSNIRGKRLLTYFVNYLYYKVKEIHYETQKRTWLAFD
ncbi:MAG: hypothetical protein ACOX3C_00740, partial [Bacilli bacterium]